MTEANAINAQTIGIVGNTGTAFTGSPATQYTVQVGGASTSTLASLGTGSAGQVLQSGGAAANPAYSTATYPATATSTGTLLRADGTNWTVTTSTYPATNAVSTLLYASSANVMSALATGNNGTLVTSSTGVPSILAGPGTTGNILQSNAAAAPSFSTSTYPSTNAVSTLLYASATNVISALATGNNGLLVTSNTGVPSILAGPGATGRILQSNAAAAPSFSTATYPSVATGTGTILRADGTNWVATTATYPTTTTVSQILYSSATNVVGEITTANDSILLTNSTGVPSLSTTLDNNFTFTDAASGGTELLTISQTSNTANANAQVKISTAGATAADPTLLVTTTTTSWILGVDNSVTSPTVDPFVISQGTALGTNNIMSVATAGEINYPLQSAFMATQNSAQNNLPINATTTLTINNEIFDQNSDYDNATFTFTSPVTGRYPLYLSVGLDSIDTATASYTFLIATSNRNYSHIYQGNELAADGSMAMYIAMLTDMDAADTAIPQVIITNSGASQADVGTNGQTKFSGYLAC